MTLYLRFTCKLLTASAGKLSICIRFTVNRVITISDSIVVFETSFFILDPNRAVFAVATSFTLHHRVIIILIRAQSFFLFSHKVINTITFFTLPSLVDSILITANDRAVCIANNNNTNSLSLLITDRLSIMLVLITVSSRL